MKKVDLDSFKGVEYIDVVKRGKTLLTIKPDLFNDKNKRWLQEYVGNELGEGYHDLSIKVAGSTTYVRQRLRGVTTLADKKKKDSTDDTLLQKIVSLERSMAANSGNVNIELLKLAYQMQIDFYKGRVETLTGELTTANEKLRKLESSGDDDSFLNNPLIQAAIMKWLKVPGADTNAG